MAEAYIYDHVRTPRGRGKKDGALHEVTAVELAATPLRALKARANKTANRLGALEKKLTAVARGQSLG